MSNPMSGESKNPLSDAKIVKVNADPREYHKQMFPKGDPGFVMSRGGLQDFSPCPSKWIEGTPERDTKAMLWGDLIDCIALTPSRFGEFYVTQPETYTNSKGIESDWTIRSNSCKKWTEDQRAAGLEPVQNDSERGAYSPSIKQAMKAAKRLDADNAIATVISQSQKQVWVSAVYQDEETGVIVPIKCLIDMVPTPESGWPKALADLKTTRNASAWAWGKQLMESWYHVQAALYLDAYTAATGEDRVDFLHIVQENEPPYQTARRMLSGDLIERGRLKYVNALKRYCRCLKTNHWPDYDEESGKLVNGWRLVDEGDVPSYLID